MKLLILFYFILSINIFSQAELKFEDLGFNENQRVGNYIETAGFIFESNGDFYTNYGSGFDVYGISLYFVWEDTNTKTITMFMKDNGIFTLHYFKAYQVSETVTNYQLTLEGWYDNELKYGKSFTDINAWSILDLNYNEINKIVIKMSAINPGTLIDFNFDNFAFTYGKRNLKIKI